MTKCAYIRQYCERNDKACWKRITDGMIIIKIGPLYNFKLDVHFFLLEMLPLVSSTCYISHIKSPDKIKSLLLTKIWLSIYMHVYLDLVLFSDLIWNKVEISVSIMMHFIECILLLTLLVTVAKCSPNEQEKKVIY